MNCGQDDIDDPAGDYSRNWRGTNHPGERPAHPLSSVRVDAAGRCRMVLQVRPPVEYVRHGRSLSGLSAPVGIHAMSELPRVVGSFGLVRLFVKHMVWGNPGQAKPPAPPNTETPFRYKGSTDVKLLI